jgi:hypothetical protein
MLCVGPDTKIVQAMGDFLIPLAVFLLITLVGITFLPEIILINFHWE